jgi:cysteine-rich repeat protein
MNLTIMSKSRRTRSLEMKIAVVITAVILNGSCLLDTKTTLCEATGLRCNQGLVCAPRQGICVNIGSCGDGVVNGVEKCDDGDIIDGNGCDSNCEPTGCGNGQPTFGEECDHGPMNSDTGACLMNCQEARCGDGKIYMDAEQCDNGAMNSDDSICLTTCQLARCGDGYIRRGIEACDDGNNQSCGTCNALCSKMVLGPARGHIAVAGFVNTDHYFVLGDGLLSKKFIYIRKPSHVPDPQSDEINVVLESLDGVFEIADKTTTEIVNSGLQIVAEAFSGFIDLTAQRPGILGNVDIILDPLLHFIKFGMSGGGGVDCAAGVSCRFDMDCSSSICDPNQICE